MLCVEAEIVLRPRDDAAACALEGQWTVNVASVADGEVRVDGAPFPEHAIKPATVAMIAALVPTITERPRIMSVTV
jgi:hypothetical protein